jgi:hypothetical protein
MLVLYVNISYIAMLYKIKNSWEKMSDEKAFFTRQILTKKVNYTMEERHPSTTSEPVPNQWERTMDDFADDPEYNEVYNINTF